MVRTAIRELISRRVATALAALGLLTGTLGFVILASTSKTAEAMLTGDIRSGWQTPYDLLVRPVDSATRLEQSEGLVRPNFLSGLNGGITLAQLARVRAIPGVQVAAPLSIVGYANLEASFVADLGPQGPFSALRLSPTIIADSRMSHYPTPTTYLVSTTSGSMLVNKNTLLLGKTAISCAAGPILLEPGPASVLCTAPRYECPGIKVAYCGPSPTYPVGVHPHDAWVSIQFPMPLIVAGIDPVAETQLDGLSRCIKQGDYFEGSGPLIRRVHEGVATLDAPLLFSDRSFIRESVAIRISRAVAPQRLLTGATPGSLQRWAQLPALSFTADQVYRHALGSGAPDTFQLPALWIARAVRYQAQAKGVLAARVAASNLSIYAGGAVAETPLADLAPPEALDTWFRPVSALPFVNDFPAGQAPLGFEEIGTYKPDCLPGFSHLAGGRMAAYAAPVVRLPGGGLLGPDRNIGGYVNSAPVILTSLAGARSMTDPTRFRGAPGAKFISAIRIKVADTGTPGPASEVRLSRVAAEIHAQTGLKVDIVKGSSPKTVHVFLAAGKFGRSPLTVSEGWSVKGVAFRFVRAVQAQNLALFVLVLVAAMVLVGQTSYTAARRRRAEFGTLRALGWPAIRVALLVELEMLILGFLVGVAALALGLGVSRWLGLGTAAWQWLIAIPLAVVMAGVAAAVPAVSAARGATVVVMAGGGSVRESRVPASLLVVGIRDMLGAWRGEAVLGLLAVGIGSALLGAVVLVAGVFRGQLDATVLGTYLSAQVQPFHVVLAILALAIGAMAAAEIVTLTYLERRAGLAALRALGWSRRAVLEVLLGQALGFGLVGGVAGAVLVTVGGLLVGASGAGLAAAGGSAVGSALVATALAALVPLWFAYHLSPSESLRGE